MKLKAKKTPVAVIQALNTIFLFKNAKKVVKKLVEKTNKKNLSIFKEIRRGIKVA